MTAGPNNKQLVHMRSNCCPRLDSLSLISSFFSNWNIMIQKIKSICKKKRIYLFNAFPFLMIWLRVQNVSTFFYSDLYCDQPGSLPADYPICDIILAHCYGQKQTTHYHRHHDGNFHFARKSEEKKWEHDIHFILRLSWSYDNQ